MNKKILILGVNGMLGERFASILSNLPDYEVVGSSVESGTKIPIQYYECNIADGLAINSLVSSVKPHFVINAAAYTNVDLSETNRDLAYSINVKGVENICNAVNKIGSHLIHFSTDYVFDGKNGPYSEDDPTNPVSFYGKTKLEGERIVTNELARYSIFRINVLYGISFYGRPDFVRWVVASLRENKPIRIVKDQINNPTFIDDVVSLSKIIIEKPANGIYNLGGMELLSRLDFTYRIADFFKLNTNLITPIFTSELKQPAPRPLNSGLKTDKIIKDFRFAPTSIENSFAKMKEALNL